MRAAAAAEHPALKPHGCAREDVVAGARAAASALDAAAQVSLTSHVVHGRLSLQRRWAAMHAEVNKDSCSASCMAVE